MKKIPRYMKLLLAFSWAYLIDQQLITEYKAAYLKLKKYVKMNWNRSQSRETFAAPVS